MNDMKRAFKDAQKIIDNNKTFVIRQENLYELKEGKSDVYLSTITPYSRPYLCEIFKGKRFVDKKTISKLLIPIFAESVKLKEKYEKYGFDTMLEHFFREV